ncbi:MAG: hypothetical protein AAFX94_08025 [Myxococcota bacterium]
MGFTISSGNQSFPVETSTTRTVHGLSGVASADVRIQGVPGEFLAGPIAEHLEQRGWGNVVDGEFRPAKGVEIEDFHRGVDSEIGRSGVMGAIGFETIMSVLGTASIPDRE